MKEKEIRWSAQKNEELKETRGVTFEQLMFARLIADVKHPNKSHQRIWLFELKNYVWAVPYVKEEKYYFLKTAFPHRKYTKKYLGGGSHEEDQINP